MYALWRGGGHFLPKVTLAGASLWFKISPPPPTHNYPPTIFFFFFWYSFKNILWSPACCSERDPQSVSQSGFLPQLSQVTNKAGCGGTGLCRSSLEARCQIEMTLEMEADAESCLIAAWVCGWLLRFCAMCWEWWGSERGRRWEATNKDRGEGGQKMRNGDWRMSGGWLRLGKLRTLENGVCWGIFFWAFSSPRSLLTRSLPPRSSKSFDSWLLAADIRGSRAGARPRKTRGDEREWPPKLLLEQHFLLCFWSRACGSKWPLIHSADVHNAYPGPPDLQNKNIPPHA